MLLVFPSGARAVASADVANGLQTLPHPAVMTQHSAMLAAIWNILILLLAKTRNASELLASQSKLSQSAWAIQGLRGCCIRPVLRPLHG